MGVINTVINMFSNPDEIDVATVLGLHHILRNKWVRMPCTIIYTRQVKDRDLKHFLEYSIQDSVDDINRIGALLKKNSIITPPTTELERDLNDTAPFAISYSLMNDKKVSGIMREFLDLSLTVEAEALRNAIHPDAMGLIYDIFDRDNKELEKLIRMKESKGWTEYDLPPYVAPAQ